MTQLRFGIRDLLWAMVVTGLLFGWWSASIRAIKAEAQLQKYAPVIRELNSVYKGSGSLRRHRD